MGELVQGVDPFQRCHPLGNGVFGYRDHVLRGNGDDNPVSGGRLQVDFFVTNTPAGNDAQVRSGFVETFVNKRGTRDNANHAIRIVFREFARVVVHTGNVCQSRQSLPAAV